MGLAPAPQNPERVGTFYERQMAPNIPGNRGPLRFEEGIATDTDVPSDFVRGMTEAAIPAPGRSNHVNPEQMFKHADETMAERAHVGSAAWVDAPSFLGEFAHGAMNNYGEQQYEMVDRSGGRYERNAPATVRD
jgi:hypothetical protein